MRYEIGLSSMSLSQSKLFHVLASSFFLYNMLMITTALQYEALNK